MHALIIEDEPLIALMIEDTLRERGYTSFAFAVSASDAVGAAQARCPDLITSDVALNPGNGIDAIKEICGRERLPVIFITSSRDEVREALPDFPILQKPFSSGDLLAAVDNLASFENRP